MPPPRPKRNDSLHGYAPDRSTVALILIDVINDLDFPENRGIVAQSRSLGERIAKLKTRCKSAKIPTIYVNDNHGRWRSDFSELLRHTLRPNSLGRTLVQHLVPAADDYVVLKPKHSAFYATPLDTLLEYIGVRTLILAGVTTNACVMSTASDAHVRDLRLFVPTDCVAALNKAEQRRSLLLLNKNFDADTTVSTHLNLKKLRSYA